MNSRFLHTNFKSTISIKMNDLIRKQGLLQKIITLTEIEREKMGKELYAQLLNLEFKLEEIDRLYYLDVCHSNNKYRMIARLDKIGGFPPIYIELDANERDSRQLEGIFLISTDVDLFMNTVLLNISIINRNSIYKLLDDDGIQLNKIDEEEFYDFYMNNYISHKILAQINGIRGYQS